MVHSESMDQSKSIGAAAMQPEHPANGVETGFDLASAARLLHSVSGKWQDRELLPVRMLQALACLTADAPQGETKGFTGAEIAEAISSHLGRKWADAGDPADASEQVRRLWKKLEAKWETKREGVWQAFGDLGWPSTPRPERIEGGGTGHLTRYRLVLDPREGASSPVAMPADRPCCAPAVEAKSVTYICEDLVDAGPLARFFGQGLGLGTRLGLAFRILVVVVLISTAVMAFLFFVSALFGSGTFAAGLIAVASVAAGYATTFHAVVNLPSTRIASAPWWLQSVDDDRLLEWRGPPRCELRSIKASRYTARCPACGGHVVVRSGGWRRGFALVGRCSEAPEVHVYSFDHVLRHGERLR